MSKCQLYIFTLTFAVLVSTAIITNRAWAAETEGGFCLVLEGKPSAIVVSADNPNPIAKLAIKELLEHVKISTGITLEVITESEAHSRSKALVNRLFIGQTKSAESAGLELKALGPDAYYLKKTGNDFFIIGLENNLKYSDRSGKNGTLYGVYHVIEKAMGVRWLWPGDLGRHIPNHNSIFLEALQEKVEPKLEWREFRIRHLERQLKKYDPNIERLAFSKKGLDNYYQELKVFLRRHRVGHSYPKIWVTHNSLFNKQFKKHPDWFAMNDKGERVGPTLNVANTELQRFLATKNPDKNPSQPHIMIGEADNSLYCHSPESMAWDSPLPSNWNNYKYRVTSNRYARFAVKVRDIALINRPKDDFLVTMFIYMKYFHAPTIDIDMRGIHGSFCPWFQGINPWYPMSKQSHQFIKDTWLGWKKTGIDLAYRPNYLLGGYVMPHLSTWQTGEMFKFAAENGMRGFDFDSLWAHWAAKGPMYYMHMRLGWDPTLTIETVRKEYFQAFGPAADKVEKYFDYWEDYSATKAKKGGVHYRSPERSHLIYPENAFISAHKILIEARIIAKQDINPVFVKRIDFLVIGLQHAQLAAEFIGTLKHGKYAPTDNENDYLASKNALKRLISFRKANEHYFFSDLIAAADPEYRSLVINNLFDKNFVKNNSIYVPENSWEQWWLRFKLLLD